MKVKDAYRSAWRDYRLVGNGEMSDNEFEQNMACLCITGGFEWKSDDHLRLYEWFLGPQSYDDGYCW